MTTWRREWVKGAPGTVPFPSQVTTQPASQAPVTIVYGAVGLLPQPPNPIAISGALGITVNAIASKAELYVFDGTVNIWRPIVANIAWPPG